MTRRRISKIRRTACGIGAFATLLTTWGIVSHISNGSMSFGLGKWLVLGGVAVFALLVLCCYDRQL